jgi:hypothetical protein
VQKAYILEETSVDRKEGGMTGDGRSGLLGVLYGLLEGVGDYESHIQDAERAFDRELADFFREVQGEDCRRAERARELLAGRTSIGGI